MPLWLAGCAARRRVAAAGAAAVVILSLAAMRSPVAVLLVLIAGTSDCSCAAAGSGLPSSITMSPAVKVGHGHYMAWTVASLPPPGAATSDSAEPVHASLFMDTSAGIMQSDTAGVTWHSANVDPKLHLGLTTMRTGTDRDGIHGFGNLMAKYQGQKTPFTSISGTDPAFFQLGPGRGLQAVVHSKPCTGWAGCANLTATGLPRSIGCIQTSCCNCPFRFGKPPL